MDLGLTIIISVFMFILGSSFASFFGVVCYRIPNSMSIVKPDSRCDSCGHVLKWYENIPVFSYIFLGGKCKECKAKIGPSGFIFELVGGIVTVLAFLTFKLSINTLFIIPIVLILLLMAMYDYYTQTILDIMWIIFAILVVGYQVYLVLTSQSIWYQPLISGAIVTGAFLLVKLIFYLILKQDCLGTGDVIVMGIAGILLNGYSVLISVLVGTLIGSILEIILICIKAKSRDTAIPFLPYLCFGIYFALLYGQNIINYVLEMI